MTDSQKLDLILAKIENQDTTINTLKDEIKYLREDMTELKGDVAELKEDVTVLKEDVAELKEDVTVLKEDVAELKEDVAVLKEDVAELKKDVAGINLLIENEFRPNIKMIAECHLDLAGKINFVQLSRQEFEKMYIRVNVLESEVKQIKRKIS